MRYEIIPSDLKYLVRRCRNDRWWTRWEYLSHHSWAGSIYRVFNTTHEAHKAADEWNKDTLEVIRRSSVGHIPYQPEGSQ